ncbi:type II secretion system F family protein [Rhodopirellula sp. MGV]|uniref:type II secretion system F family protein n=1 Tax=Rhodopirellula sp. MGV TaxID=2023130 RepID=UPI000B9658CB|nr:type II secretion system F family protein [Rhodopirellula sp. MGV]OYP31012.1 hypothetical protein CGZ80_21795 [Rhodopirellula sp. MGV]PNY34640.1 hypothetical protein C2E31_21910 [Rhodopirellula baltica]
MSSSVHGESPTATSSLLGRITEIINSDPAWAQRLDQIASTIPDQSIRRRLKSLSAALDRQCSPAELVQRFPNLYWLLTLRSKSASADATTLILEQTAYQSTTTHRRMQHLAYPIAVATFAMLIGIAVLYFIVPNFEDMFLEFDLQLPPITRFVISVSGFVSAHPAYAIGLGILVVISSVAAIAGLKHGLTQSQLVSFSNWNDIPDRHELARLAIQLAELFDEGVPFEEAIRIVSDCVAHPGLRHSLRAIAYQAASVPPSQLKLTSRQFEGLPPNFALAIEMGGGLELANRDTTLLRTLSDNYQELAVTQSSLLTLAFGVLTIVGIAFFVGFTVIAMFLPLVSLISALS